MRHVILRGFEREKNWWLVRMGKASGFRRNRPEQVTDPSSESTTQGGGSHFATGRALGAVKQVEVGLLDTSLCGEHQDRFTGYALGEQITHPFDRRGRFAGAHRARHEEL